MGTPSNGAPHGNTEDEYQTRHPRMRRRSLETLDWDESGDDVPNHRIILEANLSSVPGHVRRDLEIPPDVLQEVGSGLVLHEDGGLFG